MSSTETNLLINMYEQGTLRKEENEMSTFVTKNKDYHITMIREPITKTGWAGFSTLKYLCHFSFSDGIREVYKLTMSEIDVLVMLDNINELVVESLFSTILANNIRTQDPNMGIGIYLTKVYNNSYMSNPTFNFEIFDVDYRNSQQTKRLCIQFDENTLDDFANLVYFTFLIDIEEGYLLKEKNYDEYHNSLYDSYLGVYVE